MMTLRELLKQGEKRLSDAGVPDAGTDAWALMEFALGMEKNYYFFHENDKIDKKQQENYEKYLRQREKRIPLQQITGSAWFMGHEFYVNDQVLIPRFDTEILVEEAGKLLKPGMRILDMCTGSGCILLSLLAGYPDATGTGADISDQALLVAEVNRKRLGLEAEFLKSDLFSQVKGKFDLIVSNPPYIAAKELENLMPEVRDHEPWLALDGKEDGLHYYREIVRQAPDFLKPGGWLLFEIGYDQGEQVRNMLEISGYARVRIGKDLAGLYRTALGRWE